MKIESTLSASELLLRHLRYVTKSPEDWYALFDENVLIEFPYAHGTTAPRELIGKRAMRDHFSAVGNAFGPFSFSAVRLHATADGRIAIAEAHGSSIAIPTGASYEQDYVMVVEADRGLIVKYREYWNPVVVIEAFGGADVLTKGFRQ